LRILFASACTAALLCALPAFAQDMKDMPGMAPETPAKPGPAQPAPADQPMAHRHDPAAPMPSPSPHDGMAGMDHGDMAGMPGMEHGAGHGMGSMTGLYGDYAMNRAASGPSWHPDASAHAGLHLMRGDWMVMVHGVLNGVYDDQQGPRGGTKSFASGMLMASARRDLSNGDALNLRAMLSPEPPMGAAGYPLLLASGETADGAHPLIDRQHPHDLFMELSASFSHRLSEHDHVFVYGGLPGEPAFGPPAFMHRQSIQDSPEAPISHHWLDSTHITFGVLTAGWVHDDWKLEVSRFKGREPDQHRWDIEAPKLDSTAVRLSWNPTRNWALQASWADQKSPEQLDPADDEHRWSASAIYTVPFGDKGWWATTVAWGRRQSTGGPGLDAYALESAVKPSDPWTVFARAERTRTAELPPGVLHGSVATVSKVSLGVVHDWRIAPHLKFGLGGLYAVNFVPSGLAASHGSEDPTGAMAFIRFKLD